MRASRVFVAALLAGTTALGVGDATPDTPPAQEIGPSGEQRKTDITVLRATPDQARLVTWAVGRFRQAGLDLPPITIRFHQDPADCRGYVGLFHTEDGHLVIEECGQGTIELRDNILHELAHAWDLGSGGISQEVKQAFLEMRGLDRWHDLDDPWAERGIEQAAEIIAWGLKDHYTPISTSVAKVGPSDTTSRQEAFRLLTGREPLWDP